MDFARLLGGDWHPVHRLDRETSGILVCAKGPKLRAILAKQLMAGDFFKSYLALCYGSPSADQWTDSRSILPSKSARQPAKCVEFGVAGALPARTEFRVMRRFSDATLIEAIPKTGRTHQIRLHLAASGFSIVGDKVYGRNPEVLTRYIRYGNTAEVQAMAGGTHHNLHAWKIGFRHPITQEDLLLEANPIFVTRLWQK